jgi:lipopolysaccharide biosynthesis glycosyltransferase
MINNKIEINEDSEIINLNSNGSYIQFKQNDGIIYFFGNIKKGKIFLVIISIGIIFFFSFIIIRHFVSKSKTKSDFDNYNSFYDKEAIRIYSSTNTLSFNKLDELIYGIKQNYSQFNNIHIAMSFDNDYYLLSSATIASLLYNADKKTYIHLHIITVENFLYSTMKKLNSLKYKINNNSEFIFHNGSKAEIDFGLQIKLEPYGVGEYARLMTPDLINDTDRILVTDSGDLFFEKDINELYNYPLDDKLIKGVVDPYTKCFPEYIFFKKENYINGGVLLFNSKKWREMGIYQDIVSFYNAFKYKGRLPTPIQDILNTFFPSLAVGTMPLRYNFQGFYDLNQSIEDNYISGFSSIFNFECSLFSGKADILIEEEKNLVIRHNNKLKVHIGESNYELIQKWRFYANLTGFYEELCLKYPSGCYYTDTYFDN